MQVSPGAETETDRGPASRCTPAWGGPLEPGRTWTGMGGLPTASAAEHRPKEETVGLPPTEAVRLPPASRRIGVTPSQLLWALAAHFRLSQKPYGSCESSVGPSSALWFLPAPAEAAGGLLHAISCDGATSMCMYIYI